MTATDRNWVQQQEATEARAKILRCLGDYLDEHGRSPKQEELAALVGIAPRTLRKHLAALVAEGRVVKRGHQFRLV